MDHHVAFTQTPGHPQSRSSQLPRQKDRPVAEEKRQLKQRWNDLKQPLIEAYLKHFLPTDNNSSLCLDCGFETDHLKHDKMSLHLESHLEVFKGCIFGGTTFQ